MIDTVYSLSLRVRVVVFAAAIILANDNENKKHTKITLRIWIKQVYLVALLLNTTMTAIELCVCVCLIVFAGLFQTASETNHEKFKPIALKAKMWYQLISNIFDIEWPEIHLHPEPLKYAINLKLNHRIRNVCMSELCLRSGAYIVMRGLWCLFNFIESDEIHRYVGKT